MNIGFILLVAVVATSGMTLFSYTWSIVSENNFKEPVLLNKMMHEPRNNVRGWFIHYLIGVLFTFIFAFLWDKDLIPMMSWSGSCYGFLAGLLAVLGWYIMFKSSSRSFNIEFVKFYIHILIAHILFGTLVGLSYMYFHI